MKKIFTYCSLFVSSIVFGQQNYYTGMDASFTIPVTGAVAAAVSSQGMLAAQDQSDFVHIWYTLPVTGTEPADVSLPDLNNGGVAWSPDGNTLITTNYSNGGLQIWSSIPDSNNQLPDVIVPGPWDGGVIVSPEGKVVASSLNNNSIYIWNSIPDTNNTPPDLIYGGFGTTNNTFNRPWGMDIAPDGKLFVAEETNHRVLVFDSIPLA